VYKVSVSIPATSTNLGPGLNVLGLALSLHATVEMVIRNDDQLRITVEGEGAPYLPENLDNRVLRAAIRVFQRFESGPAGLQINISNQIPWDSGLGAETALTIGGLIAANNLIGGNLRREDIVSMARDMGADYANIIAAIFGGLSICSYDAAAHRLIYHSTDIVPMRVVVAIPRLQDYHGHQVGLPDLVAMDDVVFNLGQVALLIEALRSGSFELLSQSIHDRLHQHNYTSQMAGFAAAREAAQEEGAIGVIVSGKGPALLFMAENYHEAIASTIQRAFNAANIEVDTWVLGVDRQGMLVSVVE
jgi:homoserine kinase